jgi:PAS domain S-box-containing protein
MAESGSGSPPQRERVPIYRRWISGTWHEISARDARRISLLMAALVGLVVGTGAWELIELRSTLRGDVLQANRVVAQIVARGIAAESDVVLTEERVNDLLDELELQGGGPVHVFDGRGRALTGVDSEPWEESAIVAAGLDGRSGQGRFEHPDAGDSRLTVYVPLPDDGGVVVVDRPASAATPRILNIGLIGFVVASALLVVGTVMVGRLLQLIIRSRNETAAILSSLAEGVLIVDTKAVILNMNPAMERLGGWPLQEVKGKIFTDLFGLIDEHGDPIPLERRPLMRALQRRWVVTSRGFELTLVARDDRRIPVNLAAAPVIGPTGDLIAAVGIVRDVSYEHELDEMKSSLIATVSHELRTPLTLIRGYAELLRNRAVEDDLAQESLLQIQGSAERLSRLIEDLLSASRIESGQIQMRTATVKLPGVIDEVVRDWSGPDDRTFEIDLHEDCTYVLADRDRLMQILTNLVSNAVKYSAADGPITIRTRLRQQSAEVAVIDRGIGLSREDLSQLFDKFYRSERDEVRMVSGTGLGLYIARNLVEMQDGTMWAESDLGAGSTFCFTLPCVRDTRAIVDDGSREVS